jgi:hypothetical protein
VCFVAGGKLGFIGHHAAAGAFKGQHGSGSCSAVFSQKFSKTFANSFEGIWRARNFISAPPPPQRFHQ